MKFFALPGGGTIERKLQTIMGLIQKIFGDYSSRELKSITPIADKIEAMADRSEERRVGKECRQ